MDTLTPQPIKVGHVSLPRSAVVPLTAVKEKVEAPPQALAENPEGRSVTEPGVGAPATTPGKVPENSTADFPRMRGAQSASFICGHDQNSS